MKVRKSDFMSLLNKLKNIAMPIPFLGEYLIVNEIPKEIKKFANKEDSRFKYLLPSLILSGGVCRSYALALTYQDLASGYLWYWKPVAYIGVTVIEAFGFHIIKEKRNEFEKIVVECGS